MRNAALAGVDVNAAFDCIALGDGLERVHGSFSESELQLFAYLACLISLYAGQVTADWGYRFVGTEHGAPFSVAINDAVGHLEAQGSVQRTKGRLRVSPEARRALASLSQLAINQPRTHCIVAATSATLGCSVGIVGTALSEEPELRRARQFPMRRRLLEEASIGSLHQQFALLRDALGGSTGDLRVPAVVWLQALHRTQRTELDDTIR